MPRTKLGPLVEWGRDRLRFGVSTTASEYLLPAVLREFKESFAEHAITIEPGDTPDLVTLY